MHSGRVRLREVWDESGGWKLFPVENEPGTCAACPCTGFREDPVPVSTRDPGDDIDALLAEVVKDERQIGDGAREWTRVAPAWTSMTPLEDERLLKARRRALECRTGKVLQLEHLPCGHCFWVRFGCRTRLCTPCGERYRGLKRNRFEPLARLHVDEDEAARLPPHPWAPGGSSDALFDRERWLFDPEREAPAAPTSQSSSLKFLTLTFPDNVFVGPAPEGHVAGKNEIRWETPDQCREWFRTWTKKLRHFIGPWKKGKRQPSAPAKWGVKGYLAVWEVTAEKVCGECGLGRSKHIRLTSGKPGPGIPGGRDKRGNMVRDNDCTGWKNERRSGRFHPHLHLLVWSRFIPIDELRARWTSIGGGGQIRLEAAEGKDAVDYVLKYLAKPWAGVPDDLQVVGLYRMRRVTSCGEFYGKKFTALTAALLEPAEKSRAGIYCPHCAAMTEEERGARAIQIEQDVERAPSVRLETEGGKIVSEVDAVRVFRWGAFTPRGVEIKDLRKLGRPEKSAPEWRTVSLRLIPDLRDSITMEPAKFAVFAWNGVMVSLLSDKAITNKIFTTPEETWAQLFALEDERLAQKKARDEVPF